MFKKILLTGAWGFVGSNLADRLYDAKMAEHYVFLDAGFTGSNRKWMDRFQDCRDVSIFKMDLSHQTTHHHLLIQHPDIDCIVHLAAESHVDRSIGNGIPFFYSNVIGTVRLLELARELQLKLFLNFSTDEVCGTRTAAQGPFQPYERKMPRNPYCASKSAQEEAGFSYAITHGIPVLTTRATNIYGRRQYTEKFLPTIITRLMKGEKIPLYGEGLQRREWVHVDDICNAVLMLLKEVVQPEFDFQAQDAHYNIFHIAGEKTYANIDFMKLVIRTFFEVRDGKTFSEDDTYDQFFEFVADRKGHDFCYDLDAQSMKNLGWDAQISLAEGLQNTVRWFLQYYAS